MVRVVYCHAGVLGSNPGGPKDFFPLEFLNLVHCPSDQDVNRMSPVQGKSPLVQVKEPSLTEKNCTAANNFREQQANTL